jgi:hypothetical protein
LCLPCRRLTHLACGFLAILPLLRQQFLTAVALSRRCVLTTVVLACREVPALLAALPSCRIATALLFHGSPLFGTLFVHAGSLF